VLAQIEKHIGRVMAYRHPGRGNEQVWPTQNDNRYGVTASDAWVGGPEARETQQYFETAQRPHEESASLAAPNNVSSDGARYHPGNGYPESQDQVAAAEHDAGRQSSVNPGSTTDVRLWSSPARYNPSLQSYEYDYQGQTMYQSSVHGPVGHAGYDLSMSSNFSTFPGARAYPFSSTAYATSGAEMPVASASPAQTEPPPPPAQTGPPPPPSRTARNDAEYSVPCPYRCGTVLTGEHALGNLTRHLKSRACRGSGREMVRYICPIEGCGREYARSDGLRVHMRRRHNAPPPPPRREGCPEDEE